MRRCCRPEHGRVESLAAVACLATMLCLATVTCFGGPSDTKDTISSHAGSVETLTGPAGSVSGSVPTSSDGPPDEVEISHGPSGTVSRHAGSVETLTRPVETLSPSDTLSRHAGSGLAGSVIERFGWLRSIWLRRDGSGSAGSVETLTRPVLVVGATGRTGSRTYLLLKKHGVPVRGLVLNRSKARQVLGCVRCDAAEGIFVGDVTDPETLVEPASGAGSLVIATGPQVTCDPYPTHCSCATGECPIDVDWHGGRNVISAFARATAGRGQVVMISSDNTCYADDSLKADADPLNGFYKLNAEAFLMSSGLPYTIIKPCGLTNAPPGNLSLDAFHNDDGTTGHGTICTDNGTIGHGTIARADVARLIAAALKHPEASSGLRFDFCSKPGPGTPDSDLVNVLLSARYTW